MCMCDLCERDRMCGDRGIQLTCLAYWGRKGGKTVRQQAQHVILSLVTYYSTIPPPNRSFANFHSYNMAWVVDSQDALKLTLTPKRPQLTTVRKELPCKKCHQCHQSRLHPKDTLHSFTRSFHSFFYSRYYAKINKGPLTQRHSSFFFLRFIIKA